MNSEMDTKPKSKKEKKEEDDPRSMPTKVNLAKNKLRAMGLNMGYEHDRGLVDAYQKVYDKVDEAKMEKGYISNVSKADVRNERRFGKKGSAEPTGYFGQGTSEKAKLAVKRGEEHKAKRGVKTKGMKEEVLDEKGLIKDILNKKADVAQENYRAMRNPEKYKPDDESDKPYRERSRANRMKDPKRGINSPAFKEFMRKQGM